MVEKISKSKSITPNMLEKTEIEELRSKVSALTCEVNYWKTRHLLLGKYGNIMDNKKQYLCNDEDYDNPTGHLVGMKYEQFVHESDVDKDPEFYEDIHKFKHCPNCGAEL